MTDFSLTSAFKPKSSSSFISASLRSIVTIQFATLRMLGKCNLKMLRANTFVKADAQMEEGC